MVETAEEILYDALWRRASEIELAATAENSQLRYRIDGVRADRREFITTQQAARAITFLKRVAGLNPDERRRPQRGGPAAAACRDAAIFAPDRPSGDAVRSAGTILTTVAIVTISPRNHRARAPSAA